MQKILFGVCETGLMLSGCGEKAAAPSAKSGSAPVAAIASSAPAVDAAPSTKVTKQKEDPAGVIVKKLKDAGLPITSEVIYTEDTDPNHKIGRPNGYVAKASWADSRYEQPPKEAENMVGGTVEVFANEEDLQRRKAYVEEVTKNMPMVNQYIYAHGLALMRIPAEINPSQAREYEAAFKK